MKNWSVLLLLCVALLLAGCSGAAAETPGTEAMSQPETIPAGVETYPDGSWKTETVYDAQGNIRWVAEYYQGTGIVKKQTNYEDGNVVYILEFDSSGEEIYSLVYEYENGRCFREELREKDRTVVTYLDEAGAPSERYWMDSDEKARKVEVYLPGQEEPYVYEAVIDGSYIEIHYSYFGYTPDGRTIYEVDANGEEYFIQEISQEGELGFLHLYYPNGKKLREPADSSRGGYVEYAYDDAGNCASITFYTDAGEMQLSCHCPESGSSIRYGMWLQIGEIWPTIIVVTDDQGVETEHQYYINDVLDHRSLLDTAGRCVTWIQYAPDGSLLAAYEAPAGYDIQNFSVQDDTWFAYGWDEAQQVWCWDYLISGKLFRRTLYAEWINGDVIGFYQFNPAGIPEIVCFPGEGAVRLEYEPVGRDRLEITEYDENGNEVRSEIYPHTVWPGY